MITKEQIHKALCDMPNDRKMGFAIQCYRYGVHPEKIEETITNVLNAVLSNPAIEFYKYWGGNNK